MLLDQAIRVVERITDPLVASEERWVVGVAVGWRGEGAITRARFDEFCVVGYAPRPGAESETNARRFLQRLTANADLPLQAKDIKIVAVRGPFRPLGFTGSEHGNIPSLNTKKWFAALRPGIGICNPTPDDLHDPDHPFELAAGTAGFYLWDEDGQRYYLVSCNHVIARSRLQGDPRVLTQEAIIQPASLDLSGHDLKAVARLSDLRTNFGVAELSAFVPLRPDDPTVVPPPFNLVDVAMARVNADDRELELSRLPYGGRILGVAKPYQVDPQTGGVMGPGNVYKVGRTTGYTEGHVTEVRARLPHMPYGGRTMTFIDQIVVRHTPDNTSDLFATLGDSGSALLTDEHELAGLIFAASGGVTLVNPIDNVLSELRTASGLRLSLAK